MKIGALICVFGCCCGVLSAQPQVLDVPSSKTPSPTISGYRERGAGCEKTMMGCKPALRVDFNCGKQPPWVELVFASPNPLVFQSVRKKIKLEVELFVPERNRIAKVDVRFVDCDGEICEYPFSIPKGTSGWKTFEIVIDPSKEVSSWGGGDKKNSRMDPPFRVQGLAFEYSSEYRQGIGKIGVGLIKAIDN